MNVPDGFPIRSPDKDHSKKYFNTKLKNYQNDYIKKYTNYQPPPLPVQMYSQSQQDAQIMNLFEGSPVWRLKLMTMCFICVMEPHNPNMCPTLKLHMENTTFKDWSDAVGNRYTLHTMMTDFCKDSGWYSTAKPFAQSRSTIMRDQYGNPYWKRTCTSFLGDVLSDEYEVEYLNNSNGDAPLWIKFKDKFQYHIPDLFRVLVRRKGKNPEDVIAEIVNKKNKEDQFPNTPNKDGAKIIEDLMKKARNDKNVLPGWTRIERNDEYKWTS